MSRLAYILMVLCAVYALPASAQIGPIIPPPAVPDDGAPATPEIPEEVPLTEEEKKEKEREKEREERITALTTKIRESQGKNEYKHTFHPKLYWDDKKREPTETGKRCAAPLPKGLSIKDQNLGECKIRRCNAAMTASQRYFQEREKIYPEPEAMKQWRNRIATAEINEQDCKARAGTKEEIRELSVGKDQAVAAIQKLQTAMRGVTETWGNTIKNYAARLLLLLAVVGITWQAIQAVLKGSELSDLVTMITTQVITVGFFLILIDNAPEYTKKVTDSFVALAQKATTGGDANFRPGFWERDGGETLPTNQAGVPTEIGAGAALNEGLSLAMTLYGKSSRFDAIAAFFTAVIVAIAYAVIAAYVLLVYAEAYFVLTAGILFLGFGALQFTNDYAKRYITYVISVGAKLYCLFLVIGMANGYLATTFDIYAVDFEFTTAILLPIIGIVFLQMIMTVMLPSMLQGVINGSSIGSGGPALTGMMTAASAAIFKLGGKAVSAPFKAAETVNMASQLAGMGGMDGKGGGTMKNIARAVLGGAGDAMAGHGGQDRVRGNLQAAINASKEAQKEAATLSPAS